MAIKQVVNMYYISVIYNYINTIYIKMYRKLTSMRYFCYTNHSIILNFIINVLYLLKQI
jgi:hypothetical protein